MPLIPAVAVVICTGVVNFSNITFTFLLFAVMNSRPEAGRRRSDADAAAREAAAKDRKKSFRHQQCDQMAILIFHICPFVTMKMCLIGSMEKFPKKLLSQILSILSSNCLRLLKCVTIWRKFAKSGHIGHQSYLELEFC